MSQELICVKFYGRTISSYDSDFAVNGLQEMDSSFESSQTQQKVQRNESMDTTASFSDGEVAGVDPSDELSSQSQSDGALRNGTQSKSNSKKVKHKSYSLTDEIVEKDKQTEALKQFLFKEPTSTEIWCSNLGSMIEKLPECSQAEVKLSILNIVGRAEIEYLKTKESTNNDQNTTNNIIYYTENCAIQEPKAIRNNSNINDISYSTIVVPSKYSEDSLIEITQL